MSKRPSDGEANGDHHAKLVKVESEDGNERTSDEERRRNSRKGAPVKAAKYEKLPVIPYKAGETLKHIRKPAGGEMDQRIEVRIPPHYMSNTNQLVRARQLWGSDTYTEDSDIVAALMHAGFYSVALPSAPPAVAEVRAVVALSPPLEHYPSTSRHSIRSRAWGASHQGFSFRIDRAWLVTASGANIELQPGPEGSAPVAPTFSPAAPERAMTTRAAASAVDRRQRTMQEVTVQYNLCNEPWLKYSMAGVADRGLSPSQWTSSRLLRKVLYLETHRHRYELARVEPAEGGQEERYRWARCMVPHSAAAMRALGVPLPESELADVQAPVSWQQLRWGPTGVLVNDKFYTLARVQFVSRRDAQTDAEKAAAADALNAKLQRMYGVAVA